jgi:hypothetical protein
VTGEASTVVRGGIGVFYNRVQGNAQYDILRLPPNTYSFTADAYQYGGLTYSNFGDIDPFTALSGFSPISQDPRGNKLPRSVTTSLSVARRLWPDQVLEASYVGTFGRHLPSRESINFVPEGGLTGVLNGANLSDPIVRSGLVGSAINRFRAFPDFSDVQYNTFNGRSNYHSLQVTLSRQQAERVQYFVNYTFSKALGTRNEGDFGLTDPFDTRGRSYGVLSYDRTHLFNASYVISLPDLSSGWADNVAGRGLLDGWKVSGITTVQSGTPMRITIAGDFATAATRAAYLGSPDGSLGLAFLGDPRAGGELVGERLLDARPLALPGLGDIGTFEPPYYLRGPHRSNTDITLFKTFAVTEGQRLEFRTGIFNIFNQAYANPGLGDVDLTLQTACLERVSGVPNGEGGTVDNICNPLGGYTITNAETFGRITGKHGRRVVEFAIKYLF